MGHDLNFPKENGGKSSVGSRFYMALPQKGTHALWLHNVDSALNGYGQ